MPGTIATPPRWATWSGYVAAAWSAAYFTLGLWWSLGGQGYPFGPATEDRRSGSVLEGAPVEVVGPAMTVVSAFGVAVGLAMARSWLRGRWQKLALAYAWTAAAAFIIVIPDYTILAILAMWPAFLVFAFTGVPGAQDGLADILYWHRVNLIIVFVGGMVWAAAALAHQRRSRNACVRCGRGNGRPQEWASPEAALRWGRVAVRIALVSIVPYEVTRIAWYFGWPLGISRDFLQMMQDTPGMLEVGLGLAVMSIVGGILTHGLVARWGEVFPRWIWFAAGRRVPPALAIVPATIVTLAIPSAAMMNIGQGADLSNWALTVPGMLIVGWAAGLGAATYAYYLRRRSVCRRCGQGAPEAATSLV